MRWDDAERSRLEVALNESDVVGVRLTPSGDVDVLLHVLSLPRSGPLLEDGRRRLRLTTASELRFLLRADQAGEHVSVQPAIPLVDLEAVEQFFDSLAWGGSIYGWQFFDDPQLTADWPPQPSLAVRLRDTPADHHTFYWFNECGRVGPGGATGYCIEGTVTFSDIRVFDAVGTELPVETFIDDGLRFWDALNTRDERLSVESQQAAQHGAPKWRGWATDGQPAVGTS